MKIYYILIVIFSLPIFNACNETQIEIPTGNNTFSCYVNGRLFLPRGYSGGVMPGGDGISFLKGNGFYNVMAQDYREYTIYFNIKDPQVGTFNLEESDGLLPGSDTRDITHAIVSRNNHLYISKPGSGTITLEEYSDDNIVGTFEFTVYRQDNPSQTLRITNGNFDN